MKGTGQLLYVHTQPSFRVSSLAWSTDGHWIVYGADDGSITLLDAETGMVRSICHGHPKFVHALAWSPTSPQLVCGTQGLLWDVISGEKQHLFAHERQDPVFECVWSPDGVSIVSSGCTDENRWTVLVRSVETGKAIAVFQPPEPFDQEQQEIALAGLPSYRPPCHHLCWSPDGKVLAIEQEYKIHVWQPATNRLLFSHHSTLLQDDGRPTPVEAMAWSPQQQHFAYMSSKIIEVWSGDLREKLSTYQGHLEHLPPYDHLRAMIWLADGRRILSIGRNDAHVWDAMTGSCIAFVMLAPDVQAADVLSDIAFSPDRSTIALAGMNHLADGGKEGLVWVWKHGLPL